MPATVPLAVRLLVCYHGYVERRSAEPNNPGDEERDARRAHVEEVVRRIRGWLLSSPYSAVVLAQPANVNWATGGLGPPIVRPLALSSTWVLIDQQDSVIFVDSVEIDRLKADYYIGDCGFRVEVWDWFSSQELRVLKCVESAGVMLADVASDFSGPLANQSEALLPLRLPHTHHGVRILTDLGREAANIVQKTLLNWSPGQVDLEVQAGLVSDLERHSIEPVVLLVGADDRVVRYRHPVAFGLRANKNLSVVLVARRDGVNVALTRHAKVRDVSGVLLNIRNVYRIEARALEACLAGQTYGNVMNEIALAYQHIGHTAEWRGHYQGGPIGYDQREFELFPGAQSPLASIPVADSHALAWNPSLSGGSKVEDTFIVEPDGLRCVTDLSPDTWPRAPETQQRYAPLGRPDILVI